MVPKILNRRFALVTGLVVLGAFTFAPKASAETETFPFDIDVDAECVFGVVVPGDLELNGLTEFVTLNPATAPLTCTDPGTTLEVDAPTPANAAALALTEVASSSTVETGTDTIEDTDAPVLIGVFDGDLDVFMTFEADAIIPAGTYEFEVVVTTAP